MRSALIAVVAVACTLSCAHPDGRTAGNLRMPAERYFSAVYGCQRELVDSVVADSIVVSYPVFESIFGAPAIRGRDAVGRFAEHFCETWRHPETTIHEAVQDGRTIVLLWAFRASPAPVDSVADPGPSAPQTWGGITWLRFDDEGKVVLDLGEESSPGPMARISG